MGQDVTYLRGNSWWRVKQVYTGGEGGGAGLTGDGDWKAGSYYVVGGSGRVIALADECAQRARPCHSSAPCAAMHPACVGPRVAS